jgi:hypothetical protein
MTFLTLLLFTKCSKDEDTNNASAGFNIKIENISDPRDYFAAGAQTVPDGETDSGPAFPGQTFTLKFHAGKSHRLSFATMYGASNDLFYAPSDGGIALFNGDNPLTGNITGMISLWDAGTEVNHAPASGENGDDEEQVIKSVRNTDNVKDGFNYNNVETNIEVLLDYDGTSEFTLTVRDLNGSATPLSPVAWVVHYDNQKPIYTEGDLDYGNGLEDLAETGNAGPLSSFLESKSGYVSPIAPLVWVLHKMDEKPIFREGQPQYGNGLEMLAEVGDPTEVAFMLGKSTDLFFAPGSMGIKLFDGDNSLSGDVTDKIMLWDAGTEVNEYPGAGIHQGPGDNEEHENVMPVNDQFAWPEASQLIKVTITMK